MLCMAAGATLCCGAPNAPWAFPAIADFAVRALLQPLHCNLESRPGCHALHGPHYRSWHEQALPNLMPQCSERATH